MGNTPSDTTDEGGKAVSFGTLPPVVAVNNNDSENNNDGQKKDHDSRDDVDDDEQDDNYDQEEEGEGEPTNNHRDHRSIVPPRTMLRDSMRSSYFDLVRGTQITAPDTGARADLLWRNSNKSIRMISGREIVGPAPQWKRTLRRLGVIREPSEALVENVDTNNATAPTSLPSDAVQTDDSAPQEQQQKQQQDPSLRHFRIQSKAMQNDRFSLLFDSNKTASFISEYLRWTFSTSLVNVMMVTFLQFLFMCTLFVIFIYIADVHQPQCVTGATRSNRDRIMFGDAYQLSWTTLSTVGYGVIFPSLARVDGDDTRCLGLNILMAIEAFIGVLFGGVTGAIIFGKIARIQSIANVRFSQPVVIRYGLGVVGTGDNDAEPDDDEDDDKERKGQTGNSNVEVEWPCPVLEFRVMNELSEHIGGEIMNATINVAACSLERMAVSAEYASLLGAIFAKKNNKKKNPNLGALKNRTRAVGAHATGVAHQAEKAWLGGSREAAHATGNLIQKLHHTLSKPLHHHHHHHAQIDSQGAEPKPFNAAEVKRQVTEQIARELEDATQQHQSVTVDEGDIMLAPRRIYFKLEIETDSRPFFKRVWNIRHVLNERSPLLSTVARRMIVQNGGFWPTELNNHQAIRKHVHFEELVVSMSGTSNVSGSSVYAQKVYDYEHLNIGYSFAPMLALDDSGLMVVDHRLLNDVREQPGGGGEPIQKINQTPTESAQTMQRIEQLDTLLETPALVE